ncbi:hypothetical protein IVB42_12795 [Bradyrhizobium sp. 45]|nr:hypothetical protein [Bradyrhizobium sp. 45]
MPRLLNSGLFDSQVLDFTRVNFADLYAAVKAQGLTGAPVFVPAYAIVASGLLLPVARYLNAGLKRSVARCDAGELH